MTSSVTTRSPLREAGPPPEGPSVADDILAQAFSAVERLAADYPAYAERDILRLGHLVDRMAEENGARAVYYDEISRIAHDIRGQGALFGYPLMTRCADSLCRAVRILDPGDSTVIRLIRMHAAALHAILRAGSGDTRHPAALFVTIGLEFFVRLRTFSTNK